MSQIGTKRNSREMQRREFKAALVIRGSTQEDWAAKQNVSAHHLSQVLQGNRKSPRLTAAIAAYILEFRKQMCSEPLVSDAA